MLQCAIKILLLNASLKIIWQLHCRAQKHDRDSVCITCEILADVIHYASFPGILPDPSAVQWLPFGGDFQHWCAPAEPQGAELESNSILPWLSSYICSPYGGWTLSDGSRYGWKGTVLLCLGYSVPFSIWEFTVTYGCTLVHSQEQMSAHSV